MIDVEVIYTYYHAEQEQTTVQVANMTEKCVLNTIFKQLPDKRLAQLLKLSCAFGVSSFAKLPSYVKETNGKFYFNVERNLDADTVRHCVLKMKALQARVHKKKKLMRAL